MTYSSDRILQHIETQAYNVLDAYFDNTVTNQMGGGGEFRGGVREHALFIDKEFAHIMAGGSCDNPLIPNPNASFLPPFEAAKGESVSLSEGDFQTIHVPPAIKGAWPMLIK